MMISSPRSKLLAGIAMVFLLGGGVWWYLRSEQTNQLPLSGQVTMTGQTECLPHKGDGPHTLECAFGLKADNGNHYALDLNPIGRTDIETGKQLTVRGHLTPIEAVSNDRWFAYDIKGIISVSSIDGEGVPTSWKTYPNPAIGFIMRYDPSLTLQQVSPDEVRWYKWGPTQRGETELYDGVLLSVRKVSLGKGGMDAHIESRIEEFKNVGTITEELHEVMLNTVPAQQFSASSLGDFTMIFVPVDDGSLLEISYIAPDPTKIGFQKIVDMMLSTFTLVME